MRILLINKFLYRRGGDAIATLNTGKLLEDRGHEVIYWGMRNARNAPYPDTDLFIDEIDLRSEGGGIRRQLELAGKVLYSMEAKRKVEALTRRSGIPDLVHLNNFAHQISPSVLDVFKKQGIPCVMTMHDYKMVCANYTLLANGTLCDRCSGGRYFQCFGSQCVKDSRLKSLLSTVEMYLHHHLLHIYRHVSVFISPSRFMKEKLTAMGFKGRIEVLPNFIDHEAYEPSYGGDQRTICYFGRLTREKGILTLLKAMKYLPKIRLKVIGEGPLLDEVRRTVDMEGLANVELLGYLGGAQLQQQIRSSLFVVVPSEWYENNPLSILESFALGKPVLGARIGGIPELVRDHETGLTFDHGTVEDLAQKIAALAGNLERCALMGRNARRWVEEELNADKHYERLVAIYEYVLDNQHRGILAVNRHAQGEDP